MYIFKSIILIWLGLEHLSQASYFDGEKIGCDKSISPLAPFWLATALPMRQRNFVADLAQKITKSILSQKLKDFLNIPQTKKTEYIDLKVYSLSSVRQSFVILKYNITISKYLHHVYKNILQ